MKTRNKVPVIEKKLKILVAPLDWGLGHATRCIPLIRYLTRQGHEVVIAGEGVVATLLRSNFPTLRQVDLPGYRITYSRSRRMFVPRILLQIPRILGAIRRENRWLKRLLATEHFDMVLSDNRYGLYTAAPTRSIVLTHQLQIISGFGTAVDRLLRWWHYKLLERFDACWIVDQSGAENLAGRLSQPTVLPRNGCYVGWLSQFGASARQKKEVEKGNILIVLSGPDPMRRILEEKLLHQIKPMTHYQFTLVAGAPFASVPASLPPHVEYIPYSSGNDLYDKLCAAELVICRSGYSTLMDLLALGKKALLIPTPGQSEQEYLAHRLHQQSVCLRRESESVNLACDIPLALSLSGFTLKPDKDFHETICTHLTEWLSSFRINS